MFQSGNLEILSDYHHASTSMGAKENKHVILAVYQKVVPSQVSPFELSSFYVALNESQSLTHVG